MVCAIVSSSPVQVNTRVSVAFVSTNMAAHEPVDVEHMCHW